MTRTRRKKVEVPCEPTAATVADKNETAVTAHGATKATESGFVEIAEEAPTLGAYGCTFVLAPAWSLRLGAEDNVLMNAFVGAEDMALLLQSEMQPRVSQLAARQRQGWQLDVLPHLCADARRVYEEDNAGGSSLISESMSMELLARTFGAKLRCTEMQLTYWPAHSSMTDFSVELDGVELGVSVTRALSKPDVQMGVEEALRLLQKKLSGVLKSTAACYNADWRKQILHIWARSEHVVRAIAVAYARLEPELIANTLCLVTCCEALPELFEEKATIRPPPPPKLKGTKDEQHLRVLAESDPTRTNCIACHTCDTQRTRARSW